MAWLRVAIGPPAARTRFGRLFSAEVVVARIESLYRGLAATRSATTGR